MNIFLEFFVPGHQTADGISKFILELDIILQGNTQKLTAQTSDKSEKCHEREKKTGVQAKIKAVIIMLKYNNIIMIL